MYTAAVKIAIEKEAGSESFLEIKSYFIEFINLIICKLEEIFWHGQDLQT